MVFQTPVYNITSTDIFTTIDTGIAESFSDAFIIEISNDQIYGGCGSFSCSTIHLNEGAVQLLYNTGNKENIKNGSFGSSKYMQIVWTIMCIFR